MTVERENELIEDFEYHHRRLGYSLLLAVLAFATGIFCAIKHFPIGMIIALGIHFWKLLQCEESKQEIDKIMWELDFDE